MRYTGDFNRGRDKAILLKDGFLYTTMIYDNERVVQSIRDFIELKRTEKNIVNKIIGEDVFSILEDESVLLYYPLNGDRIKGLHAEKIIHNEVKQFVFINSDKEIDNQTWTAAHELGHVWKVDVYVNNHITDCKVNSEDIVNRFASELLFPLDVFIFEYNQCMKKMCLGNNLSKKEFMEVITYLMNTFCAPYKAVIRRFVEIGIIDKRYEIPYMTMFHDNRKLYEQIISENYYSRLGKKQESTSMASIGRDIDLLEKNSLLPEHIINKYRSMFSVCKETDSNETFLVGGGDGEE